MIGDSQCKCPPGFKGDGIKSCEGEKRISLSCCSAFCEYCILLKLDILLEL